jgi:molybdenum cofactor sulfurtransferase
MMPLSFIEHAATSQSISLRTGCMCNTGGAAALLESQEDIEGMYPGITQDEVAASSGRELGVVRISLGLATTFKDIWRVARFGATMGNQTKRQILWHRYVQSQDRSPNHGRSARQSSESLSINSLPGY